jgi:hypothetical protein
MRIFSIKSDGKFEEFSKTYFHTNYEESVLENWLENNSDDILEDGRLLIIGRQDTTIQILAVQSIYSESTEKVIPSLLSHVPPAEPVVYMFFIMESSVLQVAPILVSSPGSK